MKILLSASFLWVSIFQICAQTFPDWKFFRDGIPTYNIFVKDSIAFIITKEGFAKVNLINKQFKYFHELESNTIPPIDARFELPTMDSNGKLWTITKCGELISIETDLTYKIVSKPINYPFVKLKEDKKNQIWAGLDRRGDTSSDSTKALARFDGEKWQLIDFGISGISIEDIEFDRENNPWFIVWSDDFSKKGIYSYSNGKLIHHNKFNSQLITDVRDIAISKDNVIWVCGFYSPLWEYKNGKWKRYSTDNTPILPFNPYKLSTDNKGDLWICRYSKGLFKYDGSIWIEYPSQEFQNYRSSQDDVVYVIAFDNTGNPWIGSDNGLFKFENGQWNFLPVTTGHILANRINNFEVYSDTIWIATNNGLTRKYKDHWDHFTMENSSITNTNITDIQYDTLRKGLWIGTAEGLDFFKDHFFEYFDISQIFPYDSKAVQSLTIDQLGNLWVGTTRGLLKREEEHWKGFNFMNLPVKDLVVTPDTAIWCLASYTSNYSPPSLVYKIKNDSASLVLNLGSKSVNSIGVSPAGTIWITENSTITQYANNRVMSYDENSLPGYLNVSNLQVINEETTLAGSVFGLYVFHKNKWFKAFPTNSFIPNDDSFPVFVKNNIIYMGGYGLTIIDNLENLIATQYKPDYKCDDSSPADPQDSTALFEDFKIFPNPASDVIFIQANNFVPPTVSIQIFDTVGRIIIHTQRNYDVIENKTIIDIANLAKGIYFIKITTSDKRASSLLKLVKL